MSKNIEVQDQSHVATEVYVFNGDSTAHAGGYESMTDDEARAEFDAIAKNMGQAALDTAVDAVAEEHEAQMNNERARQRDASTFAHDRKPRIDKPPVQKPIQKK